MRVEPVAEISGSPRIVDQPLANGGAVADNQAENGRVHAVGPADGLGDFDSCYRGQGRLAGRFPHGGVAAHGGQGAVPGPNGHGKVERGDNADDGRAGCHCSSM